MNKSLDMVSLQRALETWRQGNFQERRIPEDPLVLEIDPETFAVRVSHNSEKLQLREEFILCAPDGHVYAITNELIDKLGKRLRVLQIVRDAKIKDAIDTADLPTIGEVVTGIQSELLDLRNRCGYSFNSGASNDAVAAAIDSAIHAIMSVRSAIAVAEIMDMDPRE